MLSEQYTAKPAISVPVPYRPIEVRGIRHYVYLTQFEDAMPTLVVPRAYLPKLIAALQKHIE